MKAASFLVLLARRALGCSNILIPAGSSVDGSTILAYNADDDTQVGALSHWTGGSHTPGELRQVFNWGDGGYLGAIPQPQTTYTVVGNTNEHQLSITETTFGGVDILDGLDGKNSVCNVQYGCLDYGNLIWITLARAKNAQQAMSVIDGLLQTYGYASSGESFSIADPKEVWLMEIIGKGNHSKGAVWVASRVPDGMACAHANQARTRHWAPKDTENFRFSEDVIDFARTQNLYHGPDSGFSFSDVYDPVTAYGARTCEARVYSIFSKMAAADENIDQYLDYVMGRNINNRMPLFVRVARKFSVNDTFLLMRDHFEHTALDSQNDISGGNWRTPIQLGSEGQVWNFDGKRYINARPIGIPFTQWNLVANQRPNHKYSVLWFGVDDSTFTIRAPFYGVSTRVPAAWDDANCTTRDLCRKQHGLPGTIRDFSMDSMFWVTSMVANYAYSRYGDIAPTVYKRLQEIESRLLAAVAQKDAELDAAADDASTRESATAFSYSISEQLHQEWRDFYGELFVTFVDGYRMKPDILGAPVVKEDGVLRPLVKEAIAEETGTKYVLPGKPSGQEVNLAGEERKLRAMGHKAGRSARPQVAEQWRTSQKHWDTGTVGALVLISFCVGYVAANRGARVAHTSLTEPLA